MPKSNNDNRLVVINPFTNVLPTQDTNNITDDMLKNNINQIFNKILRLISSDNNNYNIDYTELLTLKIFKHIIFSEKAELEVITTENLKGINDPVILENLHGIVLMFCSRTVEQKIQIVKDMIIDNKYPSIAKTINFLFLFNEGDELNLKIKSNEISEPHESIDLEFLNFFLPESLKVLSVRISDKYNGKLLNNKDFMTNSFLSSEDYMKIFNTLKIKCNRNSEDKNDYYKNEAEKELHITLRAFYIFIFRALYHKKYEELNDILNYILPINLKKFIINVFQKGISQENVSQEDTNQKINSFVSKIYNDYLNFSKKKSKIQYPGVHRLILNIYLINQLKDAKSNLIGSLEAFMLKMPAESDSFGVKVNIVNKLIFRINEIEQPLFKGIYNNPSYDPNQNQNVIIDVHNYLSTLLCKETVEENLALINKGSENEINSYIQEFQELQLKQEEFECLLNLEKDPNSGIILALSILLDKNIRGVYGYSALKNLFWTVFKDTEYLEFIKTNIFVNIDDNDPQKIIDFCKHLIENISDGGLINNNIKEYFFNLFKTEDSELYLDFFKKTDYKERRKQNVLFNRIFNFLTVFDKINDTNFKDILLLFNLILSSTLLAPYTFTDTDFEVLNSVNSKNLPDDKSIKINAYWKEVQLQRSFFVKIQNIYEKYPDVYIFFTKEIDEIKKSDISINSIDDKEESISTSINSVGDALLYIGHLLLYSCLKLGKFESFKGIYQDIKQYYLIKTSNPNIKIGERDVDGLIENNDLNLLKWFSSEKLFTLNELNENQKNQILKPLIESKNWEELLTLLKERVVSWTTAAEDLFFDTWSKAIEENKELQYKYGSLNLKYLDIKQKKGQKEQKENQKNNDTKPLTALADQKIPEKFEKAFKKYFSGQEIPENLGKLFDFILEKEHQEMLFAFLDHLKDYHIFINDKNHAKVIKILDQKKPKALIAYESALAEENKRKLEEKRQKEAEEKKQQNIDKYTVLYEILQELTTNNKKNQEGKHYQDLLTSIETGNLDFTNKNWQKVYLFLNKKTQQEPENINLQTTLNNLTETLLNNNNLTLKTINTAQDNLNYATASTFPVEPPIHLEPQDFIDWSAFINPSAEFGRGLDKIFIVQEATQDKLDKNYQDIIQQGKLRTKKTTRCIETGIGKDKNIVKIKDGSSSIYGYMFEINKQKILVITDYPESVNKGHDRYDQFIEKMEKSYQNKLKEFQNFYNNYQKIQEENQNNQNAMNRLAQLGDKVQEVGNLVQGSISTTKNYF